VKDLHKKTLQTNYKTAENVLLSITLSYHNAGIALNTVDEHSWLRHCKCIHVIAILMFLIVKYRNFQPK